MRYTLLGRSGLRVSEIALGTMTFGEAWGWGASRTRAAACSRRSSRQAGTSSTRPATTRTARASRSSARSSSRRAIASSSPRSTRSPRTRDDPNAGGNHRKNLVQTLEASLRRLRTDYVDLLWLHMWDGMTPVAEVVRALDDLVSSGKVLYVGISDTPAWVVSQAVTLAELRGWSPFVALQAPYSLADRDVERELLPMARALGLTFTSWGMLEGGALTGKYLDESDEPRRYDDVGPKANALAREVIAVAEELGVTPAQVAIAWVRAQPWHTVPIVGARTESQLRENLGALEVELARRAARPACFGERVPSRIPARLPRVGARPRAHLRRHVRAHRRSKLGRPEAARAVNA